MLGSNRTNTSMQPPKQRCMRLEKENNNHHDKTRHNLTELDEDISQHLLALTALIAHKSWSRSWEWNGSVL